MTTDLTGDARARAMAERRPWIDKYGRLCYWDPETFLTGFDGWAMIRRSTWEGNVALAAEVEAIKNGQEGQDKRTVWQRAAFLTIGQRKVVMAEARTWRKLARKFDAEKRTTWLGMQVPAPDVVWAAMEWRLMFHRIALEVSTPPSAWAAETPNENVLTCLMLALECDDEAEAV